MNKLTIEELARLAKEIPDFGIFVETLRNHRNIDFEIVEACGAELKYHDQ